MDKLGRHRRLILVLGNGAAGAEKQALALATKLQDILQENISIAMCRIPYASNVYAKFPPLLHTFIAKTLRNPWIGYTSPLPPNDSPVDVIIGCGRSTVALCVGYKQAFPSVFNIQIQHPRVRLNQFNAVIAPRHDFTSSSVIPRNVHLTRGTVCDITTPQLLAAEEYWRDVGTWTHLQSPKIALLVGGSCRGYSLTLERATILVSQLRPILEQANASLLVTFSRRTPSLVAEYLTNELQRLSSSVYIWDGTGNNPFMGFLSHASVIVTTPDSISMTTEAIASGKPTFVFDMKKCHGKFASFHLQLAASGHAAPLSDFVPSSNLFHHEYSIVGQDKAGNAAAMDADIMPGLVAALKMHWAHQLHTP